MAIAVFEGTPAARAGLRVGDQVLVMNGTALLSTDSWGAIGATYEIGVAMPVVVERNGATQVLTMTLQPPGASYWAKRAGAFLLVIRLAQFVTLLSGLFVLSRRPRDPAALAAAWLLLTCSSFTIGLPFRLAGVWGALPFLIGLLPWFAYASALAFGPVLLTFLAVFPRRLPQLRAVLAVTWATTIGVLMPPLYNFAAIVYGGSALRSVGPGTRSLLAVTVLALAASVAIMAFNYRRIAELNERRQLRAVVAGIAVAVLPGFLWVLTYWTSGRANLAASLFESPAAVAAAIALLAAPLSITYAVLRHRLFDISVIVRSWLRYGVARWAVLSLAPALLAALVVDLLAHGHETVNAVVRRHMTLYLMLVAGAAGAYLVRRRWLDAIDRRFFRDHQQGYALLREVAEQLRRSGSLDRVAPLVVARIEAALHPQFAALLLRDSETRRYRSAAAAPVGYAPPDLPFDTKLVAILRVVEKPLDTSEDPYGIQRHVHTADIEYLRASAIDLLVPVITPDGELQAIVALGPKRSEEPFSHEDHDLLVTIAENLALLIARSDPSVRPPLLEECRACGACFDDGTHRCDVDGQPLELRDLPRVFAGRYRLLRRIGTGGMGRVYEAADAALDKRVAVKVVRDDLPEGWNAAGRLLEEAKLAAKLVHPNVVTILDFGMVDGRRPFLVMERLSGRTLRQAIEGGTEWRPATVLWVLEGICSAMAAAHQMGLVHRDLKPENVFLVDGLRGPTPKIVDFGIARPLTVPADPTRGVTTSDLLPGTPEYMAPERLRGERVTPAWDLWSVAIIAHELLARTRPMAPGPVQSWDPGALLHSSHPQCAAFFRRALAIEPAARPATAPALLADFAEALRADGLLHELREGRHAYVRMRS